MNATTTKMIEGRPALCMTHETKEDCLTNPVTRLWIEWAERHSFTWCVARREYCNLPSRTRMSSFDDDPTETRYYWELHVEYDPEVYYPNRDYMGNGNTLDEAIDLSLGLDRYFVDMKDAVAAQLRDNRDVILAAYGKHKVYPRNDRSYMITCLWDAIRGVLPESRSVWAISSSYFDIDEAFELILDDK